MLPGFGSLPTLKDARRFVLRALGFDPDAVFVHRAGAETIGGVKTFTSKPMLPSDATAALEPVTFQQFNAGPGAAQLARRNLLVNGNFAVNQRAYVSGTATVGANQYTLDMWRAVVSGQSVTYSNLSGGAPNTPNQVTAPAGGLEQVIPGENVVGGTYSILWQGTATCTINGVAQTRGVAFSLPAGINAVIRFIGGTVSYAQIEPGTVPTAFEHIPYAENLRRSRTFYGPMRRYYQRLDEPLSTTQFGCSMYYTGDPRSAPTVNLSSTGSNSGAVSAGAPTTDGIPVLFAFTNVGPVARDITITGTYSCEP